MRALLDVSMLLALFDPKHVHHRRAHERDNGWATCPLTENGFLRIVTQQAYPNPLPFADALAMLRQLGQTAAAQLLDGRHLIARRGGHRSRPASRPSPDHR